MKTNTQSQPPLSAPVAAVTAPQTTPATNTPLARAEADKAVVRLIPGKDVFCVDCQAFDARTKRCHLMPPPTNSSFRVFRGPIDDPKTEWCLQFRLRK
jgi:hypothetical protein